MGFEFISDQPEKKLVDSTTTLSVNEPTIVEEDLTQSVLSEDEERELALEFVLEHNLYTKFMLWCGLQDQLKKLADSIN
jgi:hypothetical protein